MDKIFDTLSQYLLSGNNDLLLFIVMVFLCVGPLILMWKSTYVAEQPIDSYANAATPGFIVPDQVNETFSSSTAFPRSSNPFPSASRVHVNSEDNASSSLNENTSTTFRRLSQQFSSAATVTGNNDNNTSSRLNENTSATFLQSSQSIPSVPTVIDKTKNNTSSLLNASIQSNESLDPCVAHSSTSQSNRNSESAKINQSSDTETNNLRQRHEGSLPKLMPGQFYIRLKYLDESVQTISVKPNETIGELKQKAFPSHLTSRYRIIFKGNVLRNNDQTIRDCGILPETDTSENQEIPVLHCFLSPQSDSQNPAGSSSNSQTSLDDVNIGNFFLPLFGSILAFLWYLCVFHTSLFTIPSLFGIIGLTCFFIVILVNRYI